MPANVGTSTTASATYNQPQRKTFYANGYYWDFFSDGTNLVYRTSVDRVSWSSATIIRACTIGSYFDVGVFPDYSATHVYYTYAPLGNLIYGHGTITGASITWASEVTVYSGLLFTQPSIAILTNGRIIIVASFASGGNTYCYGFTNANNDGSGAWAATLFTYSAGLDQWLSCVMPLTAGKAYVVFCKSTPIYGNLYSAGTWYTNETITTAGNPHFSATAEGDNVHLAYYAATAFTKAYRLRTYGAGTPWGSEETIYTMAGVYAGITICVDLGTSDLYALWGESSTVYYSKKPSAGVWGARAVLASGESDLKLISINAFKRVWNSVVGVTWTKGELSPYTVRYATLSTVAPTGQPYISRVQRVAGMRTWGGNG